MLSHIIRTLTQSPDGLLWQNPYNGGYDPENGGGYVPPGVNDGPQAPAAPASGVKNPYQLSNAQIYGPLVGNLAGGALSAYGNYQQNQQNLKQNALQFIASQQQNQYNADRAQNSVNAAGVLNADPLGADQKFAQRNALLGAILPGITLGGASPLGTGRIGKIMAPTTFDPAMVRSLYGNDATMNSIAQRHAELNNLDPNAPTPNLTSMFGSQGNAPAVQQNMQGYQQQLQTMSAQQKASFEQQMSAITQQMVQQEAQQNNTSGFWHKFAQIAGAVGSVAAIALTGGAAAPILGPVMATLLGGASAGAAAWGSGGGGGSALTSAIIGGAGAGLNSRATSNRNGY